MLPLPKLPSRLQEQEYDAIMEDQEMWPSTTYWGRPAFSKPKTKEDKRKWIDNYLSGYL